MKKIPPQNKPERQADKSKPQDTWHSVDNLNNMCTHLCVVGMSEGQKNLSVQ